MSEDIVKNMLKAIGEDPDREGLKGTPDRVVRMWKEIFRGYDVNNKPKVTTFNNGSDGVVYDQMICDTGCFYSMCEHHMMPIFNGIYFFSYIPHTKGKILGLSKVARVVDYYSARLQIQERLTHQIIDYLWKLLCNDDEHKPLGMGLVLEAHHLCKEMRGVKKKGVMRTTKLLGTIKIDPAARAVVFRLGE